jgi:hypothetical protein
MINWLLLFYFWLILVHNWLIVLDIEVFVQRDVLILVELILTSILHFTFIYTVSILIIKITSKCRFIWSKDFFLSFRYHSLYSLYVHMLRTIINSIVCIVVLLHICHLPYYLLINNFLLMLELRLLNFFLCLCITFLNIHYLFNSLNETEINE